MTVYIRKSFVWNTASQFYMNIELWPIFLDNETQDYVKAVNEKEYNVKDKKNRKWDLKLAQSEETPRVLDMFAESLLFVNRLYNKEFGVEQRKVLAHMPHLVNQDIMIELQNRLVLQY